MEKPTDNAPGRARTARADAHGAHASGQGVAHSGTAPRPHVTTRAAAASAPAAPTASAPAPAAAAPASGPRILVVDDERAIADLVCTLLAAEGMRTQACHSGQRALDLLEAEAFDLVILDIMMPGVDGWEVCRQLRRRSEVPVIFLSAKDDEVDKVVGLTLGADDYVTKPFKPRELVARVKARLRRRERAAADADDGILRARGIEVDPAAHTATLHGQSLSLTPKEFGMLELLVRCKNAPVPAQRLYEEVWGDPFDASAGNSVMVHIRHLRQKLAAVDSSEKLIETAWGVGYLIRTLDEGVR